MQHSEARVTTDKAERYLGQLCKHWAHKFAVAHTQQHGRIELPAGLCVLDAEAETLLLRVEAADEAQLGRMEEVVARHLERFMFRESPRIAWRRAA
jgi:uncharacterized protein